MKKIVSFILGSLFALNLTITAANSAANEVRVAYFLEWPSPNLEDMQKKNFAKALGVPVKWTNFTNGGAMTDAMLAGDIDISYSQGLVPFINAVKSNAPIKLVDIAMEYGMGGTTCVTSNASGITKANATELEGKKVAVPLGTMAIVPNGTATFLPSNSVAFAFVIPDALDVTQVVPPIPYSIAISTNLIGAFDFTALINGTKPCE